MKFADMKSQADLDAYVKTEKETAVTSATSGLITKRDELLGEVTTLKAKVKEAPSAETITALEAKATELDEIKKSGTGDYKKLYEKSQDDHRVEMEGKDKRILTLETSLDDGLISGALSAALIAHNVNPVLSESAIQLLTKEVTLIDENGKRVARVGDKNVDKFVEGWAASDVGKNFILAGQNGGGGGGGGGPGGNGGITTEAYFDPKSEHYSVTEQSKVFKQDTALYDSLSKKFEVSQPA